MKKSIVSLLFFALTAQTVVAQSRSGELQVPVTQVPVAAPTVLKLTDDNPVPWPWGAESVFPWGLVQGVWLVEVRDFRSYFVFRVRTSAVSAPTLEMFQVDPASCQTLARGIGFEQNRVVQGSMVTAKGASYRVTLRAFDARGLRVPSEIKPTNGQYFVLSVLPPNQPAVHVSIPRLMDLSSFQCPPIR